MGSFGGTWDPWVACFCSISGTQRGPEDFINVILAPKSWKMAFFRSMHCWFFLFCFLLSAAKPAGSQRHFLGKLVLKLSVPLIPCELDAKCLDSPPVYSVGTSLGSAMGGRIFSQLLKHVGETCESVWMYIITLTR